MSIVSRFSSGLLVVVLLLAGCAGTGPLRHDSAEEAYKKGLQQFERGNYSQAIRYFQAVFNYGRSNEWADDAQFHLGRAYYQNEKYILAANAFNRFRTLYRQDERTEEAAYRRALAYYQLSPAYQMDQSKTQRAIEFFQVFMDEYPNSEFREEAQQRIQQLREKLAHKQYEAAQQYAQRGLYEAAALQYEGVFDQYPDTKWADNGLLGAVRSYMQYSELSVEGRKDERLQLAIDNYRRLVQLFPDSPLLKEAESLYEEAQSRLNNLTESSDEGPVVSQN